MGVVAAPRSREGSYWLTRSLLCKRGQSRGAKQGPRGCCEGAVLQKHAKRNPQPVFSFHHRCDTPRHTPTTSTRPHHALISRALCNARPPLVNRRPQSPWLPFPRPRPARRAPKTPSGRGG